MVDLNNKNILLTGCCGFIGSNFIEYIDKNYKKMFIVNVDKWGVGHRKMSTHFFQNENNYEEIPFDLCNLDPDSDFFDLLDHIDALTSTVQFYAGKYAGKGK